MEYRSLGRTGAKVSPLALGTNNFMDPTPEDECERILLTAMDAGINLIDTGDVYADGACEQVLGRILKRSGRRHEVLISTKVDHGRRQVGMTLEDCTDQIGPNEYGHSRLNVIRACEASLKRLDTDHIDLYQLHRPSPDIPMDETLRALDDLVRQGKVRYIGCSTHPAWMVMEGVGLSTARGWARFVSEQPPYNLLDRRIENELVPMCQRHGVGLITWAPMAMGLLAGRYKSHKGYPPESRAALRGGIYADRVTRRGLEIGLEFARIAELEGLSAAQLAVLWCKDQPGITAPLIGPRTVEHLEPLLPVLEMALSDEVRVACDELVSPGNVIADFHSTADWMKTVVEV